ncbi:hypothetical protein LX32DRAFT_694961 [Colletotrichum zoysiae]|uniref:Apple domain-containing protein n=1 Tax=Colletotrichum zoysiae TaxID=1216348 RepID=A0AAD9HE85_9PEZI|nr:hypothetical protein LX32DRAFT_694961 [Colletotrichum zoysiae]
MVAIKSLLTTIVLVVHIANAEEAALGDQLSQSPPRTATAEQGCHTPFLAFKQDSVQTFSNLYSYTFTVTEYIYTTPTTSTITFTPTIPTNSVGTITSTVTTTTRVSSYSTVTVETPVAGFVPIAHNIARADDAFGLLESPEKAPYSPTNANRYLVESVSSDNEGGLRTKPLLKPQRVICEKVIRVFTTFTSTITATWAATATTTLPGPSQQTTVTTTMTTTSTITEVGADPTRTVYEACQTNNVQAYHGQPKSYFAEALSNYRITHDVRHTDTPENCCIACQTTFDCEGSLYHQSSGTCRLYRPNNERSKCSSSLVLRSKTNISMDGVFWASNGRCGRLDDNDDDADDNYDDHEAATASTMAELDPNAWYRLSETRVDNSTGPFTLNLILRDVGLRVHPMTDGTAAWQFQPFGDVKGRYLMRLDQAGVKQQLGVCYDPTEPAVGATVACLQDSSVNDSQIWEISPWSGRSGEYKFVNVANGTSYALDVHPKANLFMNKDVDGSAGVAATQPAQHWVISSVSPVNDGAYSTIYSANVAVSTQSTTLSKTSAAATTSAPTTTAASQTATATSTGGASTSSVAAVSTSRGISPAAGAGIGVGVAIGVVGLIGAIAFFWWRRQQATTTQYSEVDAKNRGSPGAGSSSAEESLESGSYALPYGVQRADASYPGYSRGSPATLSYPVPVRGGGSPATVDYLIPATATSPSESRSLRSWSQNASASGPAVPAAVPRHQFDHPAIHNEFAPAPSNPSFESTSHIGFSTAASSQANSTTNLNDPDPLPSAHELEVAVLDMPRRQHELGDFHHGPETLDISREMQPGRAPVPHAELGAFQHGPDTFAQSHEAKMLGLPTAELGSYHHGPDTFADGHEDKMLGGCPPGAEKFQREREDKVLGSFHEVMNMAPNGRSGRQPGPSDAPGRQTYEMQSIGPR